MAPRGPLALLVLVVALLPPRARALDADAALEAHSLLYGAAVVAEQGVATPGGPACSLDLASFRHAVDRRLQWALRMLDSSGSPGPAFLWGNNFWLGSRSQCEQIPRKEPLVVSVPQPSTELAWPPFPIHFVAASFRHNSTLQVHVGLPNEDLIIVGLCLPVTCEVQDVRIILKKLFDERPIYVQQMYNMSFTLEQVRTLNEDGSWIIQPKYIIILVILASTTILMIAGTIYDVVIWQPYSKKKHAKCCNNIDNNNQISYSNGNVEISMANNNNNDDDDNKIDRTGVTNKNLINDSCEKGNFVPGKLGKLLLCYSVYTNTAIVLDTQLGAESVGAVHGLRFMGMGWILMVHTVFYLSDYADNKPQAFYLSEGFMVQVVSNSTLSVDTFFFLSGFLVSYLYYKGKDGISKRNKNWKTQVNEFFLMVLKRYVRLTPAYFAALCIVLLNMSWYSRTTLFHMTERPDELCSSHWWRNLLYINNFFSREEMCMSWSWYLSNDMQFFAIASFLLILSSSYFLLSIIVLGGLIIFASVLTGYISYINNYIPMLDQQFAKLNVLYDPPWTRIGPHLVGVATGYIVVQLKGNLPFSKRTVALAWLIGFTINVSTLFGLYERNISVFGASVYVALSRTAWGIGLAWIIIACCTNNAGFINKILSFPGWIPLSRLTYCAYLLNPMLMNSVYLSSEMAMHVEFLTVATYFFGHVGMCYFCAYVLSLAFEAPYIHMMRLFIGEKKNEKV